MVDCHGGRVAFDGQVTGDDEIVVGDPDHPIDGTGKTAARRVPLLSFSVVVTHGAAGKSTGSVKVASNVDTGGLWLSGYSIDNDGVTCKCRRLRRSKVTCGQIDHDESVDIGISDGTSDSTSSIQKRVNGVHADKDGARIQASHTGDPLLRIGVVDEDEVLDSRSVRCFCGEAATKDGDVEVVLAVEKTAIDARGVRAGVRVQSTLLHLRRRG